MDAFGHVSIRQLTLVVGSRPVTLEASPGDGRSVAVRAGLRHDHALDGVVVRGSVRGSYMVKGGNLLVGIVGQRVPVGEVLTAKGTGPPCGVVACS